MQNMTVTVTKFSMKTISALCENIVQHRSLIVNAILESYGYFPPQKSYFVCLLAAVLLNVCFIL